MIVTKVGDVYKASRITGPTHNYLGIVFTRVQPAEPKLIPRELNNELPTIDTTKMIAAVVAGIDEVSRASSRWLYAEIVEYVISDTPDYPAYSKLAKAITEAASADFQ